MKKIIYMCFFLASAIATYAQYPSIAFATGNWTYGNGITYNEFTGELTIEGSASEYRRATVMVTIPSNNKLYFAADVYFKDIVPGGNAWETPKMKTYNGSGVKIGNCNFEGPIEGQWYSTFCEVNANGVTQVELEIALQNCKGTFKIKLPQVSKTEPVTSPYSFPFPKPADTSCTIHINTTEYTPFNNDLLSSNAPFKFNEYTWSDQEVIDAINNYYPMSNLRFPGGTVANFYDYETDGYYNDQSTFQSGLRKKLYYEGFVFDYPGMKAQAVSLGATTSLLFNVMFDDVDKNKARLQSRLDDGLKIEWIELGNEHYFGEQAYHNIANGWQTVDVQKYISHTKLVAAGLKEIDPNIKTSVCANHLSFLPGSWTAALAAENYYEAVSLHNYIDIWSPDLNFATGAKLYKSFKQTREVIHQYENLFGKTPLLITEWGIQNGPQSFLNILARADIFMALQEGNQHDGIIQQAGIHILYTSKDNIDESLIYHDGSKMRHTGVGAMYYQLFEVFQNNNVYNALSESDSLETDLPAVVAKAVEDGDSIKVFVVNKLPYVSPLKIVVDGTEFSGDYTIRTFHKGVESGWTPPYDSPADAWVKNTGSGVPEIPAYTLAVVSIPKAKADCNGDINGSAYQDVCGECVGGNTGKEACIMQSINLQQGWNLVSLYIAPNNSLAGSAFPNATIVKTQNEFWNSTQPAFLNSLQTIEAGVGYLVYNSKDEVVDISGVVVETQCIVSLQDGWNLIGVPCDQPIPVTSIIDASLIKDFDGFYEFGNGMSTIGELKAGKAYFIKK